MAAACPTESAFRSQAATEHPSAASWRTSSRPMPEPPPVTTASFPLNESTARHLPLHAHRLDPHAWLHPLKLISLLGCRVKAGRRRTAPEGRRRAAPEGRRGTMG